MSAQPTNPGDDHPTAEEAARIYFLPNLMTAGNLFCGFAAVIRCIQAKFAETAVDAGEMIAKAPAQLYEQAIWFILAAVVFDSLDGRLARLGGRESLFGREFDSLADIVSFGMAPALLVFFMILSPEEGYPVFSQLGWGFGFLYLLCAGIRLARFNVLTHPLLQSDAADPSQDFQGLPVPAAAGVISSLVLVLTRTDMGAFTVVLPFLLLLTSTLMISNIRYPSFKKISWTMELKVRNFVILLLLLVLIYQFHYFTFALLFITYLFYGVGRHLWQRRRLAAMDVDEPGEDGE